MRDFLLGVADVLEEAAAIIDKDVSEKTAALVGAKQAKVASVVAKVKPLIGEDEAAKLAGADDETLSVVEKLAAARDALPSMGEPSETSQADAPRARSERVADAWNKLGSWAASEE